MKDSTVSARVENNVKLEAEDILQKLGVPVSVVPGVTSPLPLPSSARGAIVSPASVAITVYGLEVTQVDNAKTTAMANARILFVFCFMSSDSFLQLSIFLG